MQNLFTYGSLMFSPVWSRVVDGQYQQTPAQLNDYQRLAVIGEGYPVALPAPGHQIEGILYLNLAFPDLERLDMFEGKYYSRAAVTVSTTKGSIDAQTYVLKPEYGHIAAPHPWDVEAFREQGIQRFMAHYQGFIGNR